MSQNDNEQVELLQLLSQDFWKFKYTQLNALKKNDVINFSCDFNNLSRFYDEEYFILRQIISATMLDMDHKKYSFNLGKLTDVERDAAQRIFTFSFVYGYYYWDIALSCSAEQILNFYTKYKTTPRPPMPYPSNNEQRARRITYNAVMGIYTDFSKSYIEELKNAHFTSCSPTISYDSKNEEQIYYEFTLHNKAIKQALNNNFEEKDDIKSFMKLRRKHINDKFSISSNPARIVALFFYEKYGADNFDNNIELFKETDIYDKLNNIELFTGTNRYLSDKDNATIKRWVKKTDDCVKTMSICDFK